MHSETKGSLSVSLSGVPGEATVVSGPSGQGTLELGAVSYQGVPVGSHVHMNRLTGHFVVSTRFAMTIDGGSQSPTSATVMAALAVPDSHFIFRIDRVKVENTPQVVESRAKVGMANQHLLEIDVPTSITEKDSQLQNAIIFQVIAN